MAWLTLVAAGLFETGFAVALKMSHGMTKIWPTAIFAACALLSFTLLTMALRHLEVGTAYAVWTGIGAAGTAVVGMALLGETVSTIKLVSIGLVLAGCRAVAGGRAGLTGHRALSRATTAKWHCRGPDHGNATSPWLTPGGWGGLARES